MANKKGLIFGVGINDADYCLNKKIDGKHIVCRFYSTWRDMIRRCRDVKYHAKYPTYIGCYVCEDWLTFSNFKAWMQTQDWQGKELDKDILFAGNKAYSPETCAFVDSMTNSFTLDCGASKGEWPVGVHFRNDTFKFRAYCNNPFTKKMNHLGQYDCPNQAHEAWKKRKHEISCQLADLQSDSRVAQALRTRYL